MGSLDMFWLLAPAPARDGGAMPPVVGWAATAAAGAGAATLGDASETMDATTAAPAIIATMPSTSAVEWPMRRLLMGEIVGRPACVPNNPRAKSLLRQAALR